MSHCCHNDASTSPNLSQGSCCSTLPRRPVSSCCATAQHHEPARCGGHVDDHPHHDHEGHHDHHDAHHNEHEPHPHHGEAGRATPPLVILDERLARGDVSIEDYTQRRAILAP